ncbi:MAG: MBL fold metallo-hydrolase [Dehalococcoidia bacterium]|nr:MBL fold metallo-hydrolase [Dehalococcoidia bacterium]
MAEIDVVAQGFGVGTNEGMISYCGITLIRGERLTLVDVGYPARRQILLQRLEERGIKAGDIDRIVITHAHWDHSLNLLMFPNAEVVLSKDEYEYIQHPHALDQATPLYLPDILNRCRAVTTVNDGEELEPGVRVMSVPGHSPGSLAVLVETPQGIAGMVGDALPSRAAAMAPVPTAGLIFFDEEAGERSARKILDTCRFVYPGHDRPFAIEGGGFKYIQPQSVTFQGMPRDEDGTLRYTADETPRPFEVTIQPSARRKAR